MAKRVVYHIEYDRAGMVGGLPCSYADGIIDAGPEPVTEAWRPASVGKRSWFNLRLKGPKVNLTVESVASYKRHLVEEPA